MPIRIPPLFNIPPQLTSNESDRSNNDWAKFLHSYSWPVYLEFGWKEAEEEKEELEEKLRCDRGGKMQTINEQKAVLTLIYL